MAANISGDRAQAVVIPANSTTATVIASQLGVLYSVLNGSATAQTNAVAFYDAATTNIAGANLLFRIKAGIVTPPFTLSTGCLAGLEFQQGLVAVPDTGGTNTDGGLTVLYNSTFSG